MCRVRILTFLSIFYCARRIMFQFDDAHFRVLSPLRRIRNGVNINVLFDLHIDDCAVFGFVAGGLRQLAI